LTSASPGSATTPRARKPKAERREETMTRILDAAETLFAHDGLHGVTIKQVAQAAGVDTALIHYYFDDKTRLFDAVFGRRAAIANQRRVDAMLLYECEAGENLTVEGVIAAFLTPTFDLVFGNGQGWRNYAVLVAQVNNTPEWGGDTMRLHFDPVVRLLIGLLQRIAPRTSEADLYWFYHLMSGSLTLSLAQTGRIDTLSNGLCRSEDMPAIQAHMIPLFAAGFEATCGYGRLR
jgi:AcrR family transcriptional regulator